MDIEKAKRIFKNHRTEATAITRRSLSIELMVSDRDARRYVERAREIGLPIVSSSRSKGYWWNKDDYEDMYLPECRARGKAEFKKERAYFSTDPNQISLDDLDIGKEMMESAVADFKSIIGEGEYEWL